MYPDPKIGEYWYISTFGSQVVIGKVCSEKFTLANGDCYVVETRGIGKVALKITGFYIKWQPNWFWRMLGYK